MLIQAKYYPKNRIWDTVLNCKMNVPWNYPHTLKRT